MKLRSRFVKKSLGRFARTMLLLMPISLRYSFYRKFVKVPSKIDTSVRFKIAETKDELEQAFHLLYKAYVSVGLQQENESQLRVTPYHALPSTTILIGVKEDRVVATLSLIADSAFGLPSDWAADLSDIRKRSKRVAEVSALAIAKEYRGRLLWPLLKYMYEYCTRYFGADILIAALTTPSRAHELYESVLAFEKVEEQATEDYAFSNYIPVVVEHLDLNKAVDKFAKLYAHKKNRKNLYSYFREFVDTRFVFPKREYYHLDDPVMTPELVDYFFNQATDCFQNLTVEQQVKLYSLLPTAEYRQLLPGTKFVTPIFAKDKRMRRFNVKCRGQLSVSQDQTLEMTVIDVSIGGFRAIVKGLEMGSQVYHSRIQVGDFEVIEVKCQKVWGFENEVYGFKLQWPRDHKWEKLVAHLEQDLDRPQEKVQKSA
ncbi:MAG: hypothetical protein KDD61_14010 [Bdellovibrionales bacterium]|nr:hypothetical protein [Bdellovibrionales bacterium]